MRYRISAVLKRTAALDLARALADGSFSRSFPYGDLGNCLRKARVATNGHVPPLSLPLLLRFMLKDPTDPSQDLFNI